MIICVSGQMAAGKNFVCSLLEKHGFVSIDFDKLIHKAIEISTQKILQAFSEEAEKKKINLKNQDGTLNRRALGKLLFSEPDLLTKQESIVYPVMNNLIEEFISSNKDKNFIFNATVLFKTPEQMERCKKILFVKAPFFIRLFRAKKRDRLPFSQILSRFKTQKNLLSEYKKTGIPVFEIRNTGSIKKLEQKILVFTESL